MTDQPARERFEKALDEYYLATRAMATWVDKEGRTHLVGPVRVETTRAEVLRLYDERPAHPAAPVCGTCNDNGYVMGIGDPTDGRPCPDCKPAAPVKGVTISPGPLTDPQPAAQSEREAWRPIETAPKVATEILVICVPDKYGNVRKHVAHWACDTSGEEQPPFRGWFYWSGYGYSELNEKPTHWMPLPEPPR